MRYCTYVTVYGLVEATDAEAAIATLRVTLTVRGFAPYDSHAEPDAAFLSDHQDATPDFTEDYVSRFTAEQVRAILADRSTRCDPACKGWDVVECHGSAIHPEGALQIQRCDECCDDLDLSDLDIEQLPEAQEALRDAIEKGSA